MTKHPNYIHNSPYPDCVPSSTYGITQFWAEEYWAWRQIQKIRGKYPQVDFQGLVNYIFENHVKNLLSKAPHCNILNTHSFRDIPENSWELSTKEIGISTSHAPSRYKAEILSRKYEDQLRIITFDAHLDLGNSFGIHGAWITPKLARKTAIVGGWADPDYEVKSGSKVAKYFQPSLTELRDEKPFLDWIKNKTVYLTIDLDFFPPEAQYLGLSSFWNRNLFIGHSLNLNQQIQMLPDHIDRSQSILIGKEINIFENLSSFMEYKKRSINLQIQKLVKLIGEISTLFQENNSLLLSLDLVEYSAISDWEHLTLNALIRKYNLLEKLLRPVYEK